MRESYFRKILTRLKNLFGGFIILLVLLLSILIKWKSSQYIRSFKADEISKIESGMVLLQEEVSDFYRLLENEQIRSIDDADLKLSFTTDAMHASFDQMPREFLSYEEKNRYGQALVIGPSRAPAIWEKADGSTFWDSGQLWMSKAVMYEDGNKGILLFPLTVESLQPVLNRLRTSGVEFVEIAQEPLQAARTLIHPLRVSISVPIGADQQAYVNVQYRLRELIILFYSLGAVVFFYVVFFGYFFIRKELRMELGETVRLAEKFAADVDVIESGGTSRRIDQESYAVFEPLPRSINALLTTIEERNQAMNSYVKELHALLVEVLEQKDPYTRGHSVRVAAYSKRIAIRLGNCDCEQIEYAALLHDVGKVAIPETILNKPDRLSETEYSLIQTHPMRGFQLLSKSSQFSDLLPGVLFHHERMDGSGYPAGLEGDEIPLVARIIAVADVFDALTSDRAYRVKMEESEAMDWIKERKGSLFDPSAVDALETELMEEKRKASSQG